MTRTPVTTQIAVLLNAADRKDSFTHRELACQVYATDDPTAAQLSAVRRAAAKLVAAGRAERDDRSAHSDQTGRGTHWRQKKCRYGGFVYRDLYTNPVGVEIRRPPTAADHAARAAALASHEQIIERTR